MRVSIQYQLAHSAAALDLEVVSWPYYHLVASVTSRGDQNQERTRGLRQWRGEEERKREQEEERNERKRERWRGASEERQTDAEK